MATNRGGRPCKLTPAVQKRICGALTKGLPRHVSASLGGVSYKTMRDWERQGRRQKRGKFRTFLLAVERSEVKAVEFFAGIIRKASKPHTERTTTVKTGVGGFTQTVDKEGIFDWRAALSILERRWAADWGVKETALIASIQAEVEALKNLIAEQGRRT